MNIRNLIKEYSLEKIFFEGTIGIEKEGQRVYENGKIAKTPHPSKLGNRQNHPYIQTDFAESQLELITPPALSVEELMKYLSAIQEITFKNIEEDEYMWPLSIPAILPKEEEIEVAQFEKKEDVYYREYLSKKYGKYKQMVSGIHYNYGLSEKFFNEMVKITSLENIEVRNEIYMKLARQFIRYQWLLIYLYSASPIAEKKYFSKNQEVVEAVRSLRSSKYGYVNEPDINVSYTSLENYVEDILTLVDRKKLIEEREFYSSVRFRGESTVKNFIKNGIKYIEFRLFDLNPYAEFGIEEEDIRFIHLFILLMIWLDEEDKQTSIQKGREYSENTALSHPLSDSEYKEEGLLLLDKLEELIVECDFPLYTKKIVSDIKEKLINPSLTVGGRLWLEYQDKGSMVDIGISLAKKYKEEALKNRYNIRVFSNMELSTQALIHDAIRYGIKVEVLDENDQFLRLEWNGHVEYVKNGNMTSKDSYISPLIMENKVVTKKVLSESNFKVPSSIQCENEQEAREKFYLVKNKPIVIKPKSTNYGLGITIFKNGTDNIEEYIKAVNIALKEDKEIMIEDYIEGTEYRFFVIGDKTEAVLLRVPANVVGDGFSTIEELVAQKNKNPLRGDASRTPLKKISLDEIEMFQLKEQGYDKNSILAEGEIAYLRANSNISTGGDSIDMTDEVHESYKEIAVGISQAMFAKVCGIDLIIPDIKKDANSSENSYGVIEANFNPMMMMHIFPHQGKSRRLTINVLKMLFPEKEFK